MDDLRFTAAEYFKTTASSQPHLLTLEVETPWKLLITCALGSLVEISQFRRLSFAIFHQSPHFVLLGMVHHRLWLSVNMIVSTLMPKVASKVHQIRNKAHICLDYADNVPRFSEMRMLIVKHKSNHWAISQHCQA